jgi:thioesterase domain-containing protein
MSLKQRLARLELRTPKVSAKVLAARLDAARRELDERWAEFAQTHEGDRRTLSPEEEAEAIRELRRELEERARNARPMDAPIRSHWRARRR